MQEEDHVGQALGKAHIVGDHDAGLAQMALEDLDQVAEAAGNDGIDHGGWLVVQHNLRLPGEGSSNGHGALAACREAGRQRFHHIFGAHYIDQLGNLLLYLLLAEAAVLTQRKGHVLAHAE